MLCQKSGMRARVVDFALYPQAQAQRVNPISFSGREPCASADFSVARWQAVRWRGDIGGRLTGFAAGLCRAPECVDFLGYSSHLERPM